jgi:hypothetical protein
VAQFPPIYIESYLLPPPIEGTFSALTHCHPLLIYMYFDIIYQPAMKHDVAWHDLVLLARNIPLGADTKI